MKIIGNMASVRKNTNTIISTTFADWSAIRSGTFIKFVDDFNFFTVSHVNKKTFLKDFVKAQSHVLQINENCGVNINEGDSLTISYKEYELSTVYKLISAGKGYSVGDVLTLDGGTPSLNLSDNTLNSGVITVNKIGEMGEILEFDITEKGKYITSPETITSLKGGDGSGAVIECGFKLSDHRSFIERDVERVEFKGSDTLVYLYYALPDSIKEGKLSIIKWEIVLTGNYTGENKINQTIQIIRDFTPNYRIPLLAQNAQNQELIFNNALITLDKKVAELEDKIKKLGG